jgi:ABC-type antimicrobial peptide transport system permease subunit
MMDSSSVEAYLPLSIRDVERSVLVLHTGGDLAAVVGLITRTASQLDESVMVIPMSSIVDNSRQGEQTGTKIFGAISLVGTALAAAGMFALMAFTVVQRRR